MIRRTAHHASSHEHSSRPSLPGAMLVVLYGMIRNLANRLKYTAEIMDGCEIAGYTFLVDDRTVIDEESFSRSDVVHCEGPIHIHPSVICLSVICLAPRLWET
jgi:hypothetical protein